MDWDGLEKQLNRAMSFLHREDIDSMIHVIALSSLIVLFHLVIPPVLSCYLFFLFSVSQQTVPSGLLTVHQP